jgi:hypothetical protein
MGLMFNATHRLLTPGNDAVPIVQEAEWPPGPGLEGCGKSLPQRDSFSSPSSPWRVAIPTELSLLPYQLVICIHALLPYFARNSINALKETVTGNGNKASTEKLGKCLSCLSYII